MEQLVARRAHNPKVAGSNPAPATRFTSLKLFDIMGFGLCCFKAVVRENESKTGFSVSNNVINF